MPGAVMTQTPEEFLSAVSDARDRGSAVLAVVAEPYLWAELSQSNFGKNGAKVDELIGLIGDEQVFVLVCAPDIKRMKVQAGWHDDAVPIRILSVGNPALLRQMVSTDVSNKIYEGSFNMARADIIKAYYYNKTTGKFGRMRMFPVTAEPMDLGALPVPDEASPTGDGGLVPPAGDAPADGGWAGLTGN